MESDQVRMYQISKSEQSDNKKNVVLRALVGDPNRHKTVAEHPPPTTVATQEATPASMYTLETRYRPIPPKVLPKRTEPRVYYIDSQKAEQTSPSNPPITKEEPDTLLPAEAEAPKNMEEEQKPPPVVFLEPKIILQPVLYSIVAAKTLPIPNDQPVPTIKETPSSLLYTITGQPHRPTKDMNASALNVPPPVIDKSPILYNLVASPRLQVRFQEPIERVSQIPQQSSSNHYSVVGNPNIQPQIQESVKQISQITKQPSPTLYPVVGNPNLQPQIQEPIKQIPQQPSPTLYSIVGNSNLQPQIQEPVKQISQIPKQSSSTLYSVVGNPTLTPHIIQTNTVDLPPSKQPIQVSSVQPVPTLYTIVGETQVPNNIPKENRPPLAPIKRHVNDVNMYTVVGDPNIPQSMTIPRKTQPLQLQKEQQPPRQQQQQQPPSLYPLVGNPNSSPEEIRDSPPKILVRKKTPPPPQQPQKEQQQQPQKQQQQKPQTQPPSLYPLVGNPNSPPEEIRDNPPKLLVRKKTPPPPQPPPPPPQRAIVPTRRISRSLDRPSAQKEVTKPVTSVPPIKNKRQPKPKESTIPKSETIYFPLAEKKPVRRPKKPRTTPWHTNPEQLDHNNFQIPEYDPLHLPDYISPYTYHPVKSYREQTVHPSFLPAISNNRPERKPRPPLYEARPRPERKQPYDSRIPHSLERYPVKSKERPRLWDYEYQTQTDVDDDDDDDMDGSNSNRKKQSYRRIRPRTPWIPVW